MKEANFRHEKIMAMASKARKTLEKEVGHPVTFVGIQLHFVDPETEALCSVGAYSKGFDLSQYDESAVRVTGD